MICALGSKEIKRVTEEAWPQAMQGLASLGLVYYAC